MPNIIDHIIVEIDWTSSGINDLDTTLTVADVSDSGHTFYPPGCPSSDINSVCADYIGPVGACTDNLANYVEYAGDHTGVGKESFVVRISGPNSITSDFPTADNILLLPKAQWAHNLKKTEKDAINIGFIKVKYELYSGGIASVVDGQYVSNGILVKTLYTLVDPDMMLGSAGSKLRCCLLGGSKGQSCDNFVCVDALRINWVSGLNGYQNPPVENRIYTDLNILEGYCDRSCCNILITDIVISETFSNGDKTFKLTLDHQTNCCEAKASIAGAPYIYAKDVRCKNNLVFATVNIPGPTENTNVCFKMDCCSSSSGCTTEDCGGFPCSNPLTDKCCSDGAGNCGCCPEITWVCCPGQVYCAASLGDCPP